MPRAIDSVLARGTMVVVVKQAATLVGERYFVPQRL
jgi:hypothetical protein